MEFETCPSCSPGGCHHHRRPVSRRRNHGRPAKKGWRSAGGSIRRSDTFGTGSGRGPPEAAIATLVGRRLDGPGTTVVLVALLRRPQRVDVGHRPSDRIGVMTTTGSTGEVFSQLSPPADAAIEHPGETADHQSSPPFVAVACRVTGPGCTDQVKGGSRTSQPLANSSPAGFPPGFPICRIPGSLCARFPMCPVPYVPGSLCDGEGESAHRHLSVTLGGVTDAHGKGVCPRHRLPWTRCPRHPAAARQRQSLG
jgi:hypothetical protein